MRHVDGADPAAGGNGVLIAARQPFDDGGAGLRRPCPSRIAWSRAEIGGLRLCGVYMPNMLAKVPYWEALIARLAGRDRGRCAGDRRFQYLPRLCRRAGRSTAGYFMDGSRHRVLRSVAPALSGGREFPGTAPRQRVPHRPRVPVAGLAARRRSAIRTTSARRPPTTRR